MTSHDPRDARRASTPPHPVGRRLRAWRDKRRLSQMELGFVAGVSPRHLSYVETGRARPSAEQLVALSDVLEMPLRERNALLLDAGFAPRFSEAPLDAPDLVQMRLAVQRVLDAHDPFPGLALDRHWNIAIANAAARRMTGALPDELATPPVNVFRASLHPRGMAAFTNNFEAWGTYLLRTLERLAQSSIDETLTALLDEVRGYPNVQALFTRDPADDETRARAATSPLVPCVLELHGQRLSMFTMLTTFATPRDVTLAETTLELFYPSDAPTAAALRALAQAGLEADTAIAPR